MDRELHNRYTPADLSVFTPEVQVIREPTPPLPGNCCIALSLNSTTGLSQRNGSIPASLTGCHVLRTESSRLGPEPGGSRSS